MDESKQFEEAIAKYTLNYWAASGSSTHGYTHGYRDGAESQRQHDASPMPCGHLQINRIADEHGHEVCTVCASEQALRSELERSNIKLDERLQFAVKLEQENGPLRAELTTLRDKLRGMIAEWDAYRPENANSDHQSGVMDGYRACMHAVKALLAEEAGL